MALEINNCCGFSLKNGTIVIGVLQTILSFMSICLTAAYADNPHELVDMSDASILPNKTVLKTILIATAVGSGIQCIFSIMVIFGALMNNPRLLLPWLILYPIILAMFLFGTFTTVSRYGGTNRAAFIIGHLVFAVIMTIFIIYQILVVRNFSKHLRSLNF